MKRAVVLGIVLLAAVGGGLWWWKSSKQSGDGARSVAASTDAGVTPGAQRSVPRAESSGPPEGMTLRHDDDPRGNLRLEGQVVDEEDRPVGGAVVALSANPPREVTTENDGSFAFDGLLSRGYAVAARKDDAHAGPTNVNVGAKTEPVTLRLRPGVTLEITVKDGDTKKPIVGARVEARGLATQTVTAGTGGVARLRGLAGGWESVKVDASGYAPAFEVFQISRQPGAVDQQTVLLERGTAVAGRVVDGAGQPIAGARVLAVPASALWVQQDERLDAVETDAQGKWKVAAVAPGGWRFQASHEKYATGQSAAITVAPGNPPAEVVITLQAGARIAGEVRSAKGERVPFASVRVAGAAENNFGLGGGGRNASCDAEGRFTIDGLPRQKMNVLAAHETGSSEVTAIDLETTPAQKDLVLVLSQDGAIAGTVVTPAGVPIPEARVIALPELDAGDADTVRWQLLGSVSDVADQAGAFRLSGLPKGRYRLRAMRQEASMQDPSMWQRKSEVAESGATGVRVVLEDDAIVKGKVLFADGSAPDTFAVGTSQWGAPTPFSSKSGEFRLEGVAPGKRLFTVSGPGFARKTTDEHRVKPGVETDIGTITIERGRTVRGKVVRPDGSPAEGAKVFAGGRLFGDGESIAGASGGGAGIGTKQTETDAEGRFEIVGLGVKSVLLVADHKDGRSTTMPVPPGTTDVSVTIPLLPAGVLVGKVTSGGAPLPGAMVMAQGQQSWRGQFIVTAGQDGSFRFDRLGADIYQVSGMRARGMTGGDSQAVLVRVEAGKTAEVTLTLPKSDLSLAVTVQNADAAGEPLKSAVVILVNGRVSVDNVAALEAALAARGEGSAQQQMMMGGQVTKFENLTPGLHSVCVLPILGDPMDATTGEKLNRDPDALPIVCKPVTMASAPDAQSITVPVPLPK